MNRLPFFLSLFLSAWLALNSGFTDTGKCSEPIKTAEVEGITEYQFNNGLKLLLFPDQSKPKVTVNMTVLVGSRHEGYGEAGMAHLLEHMLFKGTPTYPDGWKELRERGAGANGTTWFDRTNYYETMNASDDNLEFGISFEADRLMNCFVRREDLLSEMTVVRNEFEQFENSPSSLLYLRQQSAAFMWHNYGRDTIGNRSDIENVPIEKLQDFYKLYYQPDNVVIVVAGKFDPAKALALTQTYFGTIPRPERRLSKTYTVEPPQDGERRVELRRVGDLGHVDAMYHIPAGSHPDTNALSVLSYVLTRQPTGALYKALVETKLASSVGMSVTELHDPGMLDIYADIPKDKSIDEVSTIMLKTIDAVITEGVSEEDVALAKLDVGNSFRRYLLDTQQVAIGLSEAIGMGDWRLFLINRDRNQQVTAADLQRVAATYLRPANRTLGFFRPSDTAELVAIPAASDLESLVKDYQGQPVVEAVPEFDYSYENVEAHTVRITLPNGIKAALLPKPTRDAKVQLQLMLRYGDVESLRGFVYATSLLPSLMCRGTKELSLQQLRDEMTKLDVSVSGFGGNGVAVFYIEARRDSLIEAITLLKQVLREPKLDESEFETLKLSYVASREQSLTDPSALARNLLMRTTSPYPAEDIRCVLPLDESIAKMKQLEFDTVRRLYNEFLGGVHGDLVIVGDFDPETTLKHLNVMLADWHSEKPYERIERQAFLEVPGGSLAPIVTPDKANANYMASLTIAMDRFDPDYAALLLGADILGGSSVSSRLANRVRQQEGLSYGVSAYFYALDEDKIGTLFISAICNPQNIAQVESAIRQEFERLLNDGIEAEEFERARTGLLESRKQSQSSDSSVKSKLQSSLRTGRTLAYETELDARLAALTAAEVQAALRKHFDPQRLVVATAGEF